MTAITPNGTLTFSIFKPFGLVSPPRTFPTGSSSETICRIASAIDVMRLASSFSRSISDGFIPFSSAFLISTAFCAMIACAFSSIAAAIRSSAAFFCAVPVLIREREAFLALIPREVSILVHPFFCALKSVPVSLPSMSL